MISDTLQNEKLTTKYKLCDVTGKHVDCIWGFNTLITKCKISANTYMHKASVFLVLKVLTYAFDRLSTYENCFTDK